jgi:hypothetical protein
MKLGTRLRVLRKSLSICWGWRGLFFVWPKLMLPARQNATAKKYTIIFRTTHLVQHLFSIELHLISAQSFVFAVNIKRWGSQPAQ